MILVIMFKITPSPRSSLRSSLVLCWIRTNNFLFKIKLAVGDLLHLTAVFTATKYCQGVSLFSLFCSLEKPSHAHGDQLLHREPVLRRHPGHNHMSSCKSCGGHYRNLVLRTDPVQDTTLLTGEEADNIYTFSQYI